jgi:hypothetical protein
MLREDGSRSPICSACLDRLTPGMRLGNLRRQFIRDRKAGGACPNCGWTSEEIVKTGLVGCPLCYEALEIPKAK